MTPQHLFVYGTLRPHLARGEAQALIATLEIVGPATVQGKLYDFGAFPGATNEKGIVFGVSTLPRTLSEHAAALL